MSDKTLHGKAPRIGARQQISFGLKFRTFHRTHSVQTLFSTHSGNREHLRNPLLLRSNGLVDADVEIDTIELGIYGEVSGHFDALGRTGDVSSLASTGPMASTADLHVRELMFLAVEEDRLSDGMSGAVDQ